jgi:hypothetical protein
MTCLRIEPKREKKSAQFLSPVPVALRKKKIPAYPLEKKWSCMIQGKKKLELPFGFGSPAQQAVCWWTKKVFGYLLG